MVPKFYKKPWIIIGVCVAITAFFAFQLPKLKVENDAMFEYLPHSTSDYQRLLQAEEEFGSVYSIGIALETDEERILTPEYINVIKHITDRIEALENVEGVDSLADIDYVCSVDGSLVAQPLVSDDLYQPDENGVENFMGTTKDVAEILNKIGTWSEMYDLVILSDDYKATQMVVHYANNDENGVRLTGNARLKVLDDIENIVNEEVEGTRLKATIYGDPVISKNSRKFMMKDLVSLIPLVVVVIVLSLFISFKTVDGTVLPLISVLMATVWSCGLMAMLGIQFTIISSVIPVALIAVDSAYGIHVLTHYYIALDKITEPMTKELHAEAIWTGVKDVFQAVLLAGITTMVGFISLITSPLEPLHSFAIFTSLGVLIALVLAITFIPAMLMIKPVNKIGQRSERMEKLIEKAKDKAEKRMEKVIKLRGTTGADSRSGSTYYNVYSFFTGSQPRLVATCLAIIVFSVFGIKKLVIDTAFINYFPKTSQPRLDVEYVNDKFAGTATVYMLVSVPENETAKVKTDDTSNAVAADEVDWDNFDFDLDSEPVAKTVSAEDVDWDNFDFDLSGDSTGSSEAAGPGLNMTNVELLYNLEKLQNYLIQHNPEIGKVVSFTTFIKRMNQVMNAPAEGSDAISSVEYNKLLNKKMTCKDFMQIMYDAYIEAGGVNADVPAVVDQLARKLSYNGYAYNEIPYDVEKYPVATREELNDLVSQYLMLLGGDTLEKFAIPAGSFSPTKLRVTIQLKKNSTIFVGKVIRDAKAYAEKYFPEGYVVEFTGAGQMENVMTDMIVSSQMTSLLLSLLSVFIIISISFKSGWAGLIGAIPLAFTILLNYMVMGLTGINLDLVTSIIASVAIGVGIDYTIHFLETFRNERAVCDDMTTVLMNTFTKSGNGIMTNAIAIGLGFLVLCLSQFVVLRYIGILVAIVMFSSSILAMTIIPGILHIFDPKFMKPKSEIENK